MLRELQHQFQSYLIENDEHFSHEVTKPHAGNIDERMLIYGEAYFLRLIDILGEDFPALKAVLGDEDFQKLSVDYLDHCPSEHYSPRFLGARMPSYLEQIKQADLVELATFEWALTYSIDCEDADVLITDDLANVAEDKWGELSFSLHPSFSLMSFHWNAVEIRAAVNKEELVPDLKQNGLTHHLVWRKGIKTCTRVLSEAEVWMLNAMSEGKTFADICEGLCEWFKEDEVGEQAIAFLISAINDGLITR